MSETGSEVIEIVKEGGDTLTFSESKILTWKVLDILSETRRESPFFEFQGIEFHMILEMKFCKNIRDDSLEMYIEKYGSYSGEFRDFDIRTCIKTLHVNKYIKNAAISSSVLTSRTKIWSVKRKSLLIDYDILSGRDSPEIVKLSCEFENKSELPQLPQQEIFEHIYETEQSSSESEDNYNIQSFYPVMEDFNHLTRLSSDFRKICQDGSEADMILNCKGQTFAVQKAILLARCAKFEQECSESSVDGISQVISMEPTVLGRFLEYVYTGTSANLTEDIAVKLYDAGNKYEMKHLPCFCCDFLKEKLRDNNALVLLLLSNNHKDEMFKKKIISFLLKNDHILRSKAWSRVSDRNPTLACEVFQLAHKMFSSD